MTHQRTLRRFWGLLGALCCVLTLSASAEQAIAHGQTRLIEGATLQAWDAQQGEWVSPESFWQSIAQARGGLRWGKAMTYPPYAQVRERDLLLIELEQGPCLMEFWHRRWRRAQDVRRWSEAFNGYGGCPYVFD